MSNETFADRLRNSMELKNIKQVDLIRIASEQGMKLGKSHVSQYVSGKTVPRPDMIHFLAGALQVDELWLGGSAAACTGADTMPAPEDPPQKYKQQEELSCGNLENHRNWIMYYMMSEDRLWKRQTGWKKQERMF